MKRRLALAFVLPSALILGACGPYADRDLNYKQVDEAFLADTTVVIASSRPSWASNGSGATLFVKRDGTIQRIDNAGLEGVQLAHTDGRVGFSDLERDYILGRDRLVSKRNSFEQGQLIGSSFIAENLVSVVSETELDDSETSVVTRTGGGPTVSSVPGYGSATATCDNGLWVLGSPVEGEPGYVDEYAEETETDDEAERQTVMVRPIEPTKLSPIAATAKGLHGYSIESATCEGNRLIAISPDWSGEYLRVLTVNVDSGKSSTVGVQGYLAETLRLPETDPWKIEASALYESDIYVVISVGYQEKARYTLARVNVKTGESEKVASIKGTADVSTHFRFADDVLHVLDVTWRDPSRVRAFSIPDGKEVGSLEFDWIEPKLNSRFTTQDRLLEVHDFVVLQPGLVSEVEPADPPPTEAD